MSKIFKVMIEKVRKLAKHPFNVMPVMTAEERDSVKEDIKTHGFDENFPIILYQNKVLDGWHRQEICVDLDVEALYEDFPGNDQDAINFVWRAAKRRNITSSQWAVAAAKALPMMDEIMAKIKTEKAEKLHGNQNAKKKQMGESIPPIDLPKKERNELRRSRGQLAKMFHTNTKYLEKVKKLSPEQREQIERGELSISDIMRAEKTEGMKVKQKEKARESLTFDESRSQTIEISQESQAKTPFHAIEIIQESANEPPLPNIDITQETLNEAPSPSIKITQQSLTLDEPLSQTTDIIQESLAVYESPSRATDITQESLAELSDEEILKLVRAARRRIKVLQNTMVQKEIKTEMESIFINVSPLEKIKEIQLALGKKLTE
jgi:hypothetical protein